MSTNARSSTTSSSSSITSISDKVNDRHKILGTVYGIGMNVNEIIGSGIVTAPGNIWRKVKSPPIVLVLWAIGGLISLAGSLSYVELGVMHKESGGETKYLQTAFPHQRNMMSFLFSFMFIFAIRPGILSAILQSAAQYFWYTIKGYRYSDDIVQVKNIGWHLPFSSPFWFIKLTAIVILFIITAYHMFSNRLAKHINQGLTVIKLATYSIIAIAGIYRLCINPNNQISWKQKLIKDPEISDYPTSILLIMFSYNGWNNLNYSLDEFRNPEENLFLSNSISVGVVTVAYLLVNVAYISVVPGESVIDSLGIDETIAATFFHQLFGNNAITRVFTFLVVLSVTGTAAASVWSGSRVIVAAAKYNFFPKFSQELRYWHNYFDTPVNALTFQFVWCSLIILFVGSSFPSITPFELFSNFAIYSSWIFYFATGIGLLVIRFRNRKKPKERDEEKIDISKTKENEGNEQDEENETKFNEILENKSEINEEMVENGTTSSVSANANANASASTSTSKNSKSSKLYKVKLPIVGFFILAGIYILPFSFIVDKECPGQQLDPQGCKIQRMAPFFISYTFLLVGLILHYCWRRLYG